MTCWAFPLPTLDADAVIAADVTKAMDLCQVHGTIALHDDVPSIRTSTTMRAMRLLTPAHQAGRVVPLLTPPPGMYSIEMRRQAI